LKLEQISKRGKRKRTDSARAQREERQSNTVYSRVMKRARRREARTTKGDTKDSWGKLKMKKVTGGGVE